LLRPCLKMKIRCPSMATHIHCQDSSCPI
jgi:hypothetical protein